MYTAINKRSKTPVEDCGSSCNEKSNPLGFLTAQKTVQKFLTERRIIRGPKPRVAEKMTKEELAKELGIEPIELSIFNSPAEYAKIDPKVPLALINLYCTTSWENGEY